MKGASFTNVVAVFMAITMALFAMLFMDLRRGDDEPQPLPEHGPPAEAATLDYEDLYGLDPAAANAAKLSERITAIEERVNAIESDVGDLQNPLGAPLGAPSLPETEEMPE